MLFVRETDKIWNVMQLHPGNGFSFCPEIAHFVYFWVFSLYQLLSVRAMATDAGADGWNSRRMRSARIEMAVLASNAILANM